MTTEPTDENADRVRVLLGEVLDVLETLDDELVEPVTLAGAIAEVEHARDVYDRTETDGGRRRDRDGREAGVGVDVDVVDLDVGADVLQDYHAIKRDVPVEVPPKYAAAVAHRLEERLDTGREVNTGHVHDVVLDYVDVGPEPHVNGEPLEEWLVEVADVQVDGVQADGSLE